MIAVSQPRGQLFLPDIAMPWRLLLMTTLMSFRRSNAYLINIIRTPLFPLAFYLSSWMAYTVAGRGAVAGMNVTGFLMIGVIGMLTFSNSVWGSGYAIEDERYEGTIAAVFLSPASRVALVAGHGLGGLIFLVPAVATVLLAGLITGARLNAQSIAAIAVSGLALLIASLATGYLLAAFFILSRRANLMANVVQHPGYLLSGFIIPREELPGWLYTLSELMPAAHAIDAFRAATLVSASLGEVLPTVGASLGLSALVAGIGALGIRRVEHAAKRTGQLELY
jgi:ABC-2 type transport system permease protein